MSDKLQQAITLIKTGDKPAGRQLLAELLKTEPRNETAWLWLSSAVSDDKQRCHCLRQVLAINPNNPLAQKGLAKLQPHPPEIEQARPPVSPPVKPLSEAPPPRPSPEVVPLQQPAGFKLAPLEEIPQPSLTQKTEPVRPLGETAPLAPPSTPSNQAEPLPQPTGFKIAPLEASPQPPPTSKAEPVKPAKKSDRRIWFNPNSLLNRLTILFDDAVVAANPSRQNLDRIQTELASGTISPDLFGSDAEVVPLSAITSVSADRNRKDINIRHKKADKADTTNISFADGESRNEFFQALQQKLGTGFEYTVKAFNIFEAMLTPIFILGVTILATYLFYGAALEFEAGAEAEIRGRRQLLKMIISWLVMLIGPTGVLILGIILAALILFWMFSRILQPPVMMTLTPAKQPASGNRVAKPSTVDQPAARPAPPPELKPLPKQQAQPVEQPKEILRPIEVTQPKKLPASKILIRVILAMLILGMFACVAGLFMVSRSLNNSLGFPGLIEGGLALDLSGRGMSSADLEALSIQNVPQDQLVVVDLSRNQLTELPPEIGQLRNIRFLYIKDNQLTRLPPEIGQLTNLELLTVMNNQLTELPSEIGQLTKLKDLDLQGNRLTELPPEIGRLPNLEHLNLARNNIRQLPSGLEGRPGLIITR